MLRVTDLCTAVWAHTMMSCIRLNRAATVLLSSSTLIDFTNNVVIHIDTDSPHELHSCTTRFGHEQLEIKGLSSGTVARVRLSLQAS
jgi:hypothetical protein